jgi:hypothetical protein
LKPIKKKKQQHPDAACTLVGNNEFDVDFEIGICLNK